MFVGGKHGSYSYADYFMVCAIGSSLGLVIDILLVLDLRNLFHCTIKALLEERSDPWDTVHTAELKLRDQLG